MYALRILGAAREAHRKGIGAVALARRLAGIRFVLWRDGTTFDPARVSGRCTTVAVAA